MSVRMPLPKGAASILRTALKEKGLEVTAAQALDLVARVYGYNSWYALSQDPVAEQPQVLVRTHATEYALRNPFESCSITVEAIRVQIASRGEGVTVALWPENGTGFKPLDSASALFAVAQKDQRIPDPTLPFHGCVLPYGAKAIEFIGEPGSHICPITDLYDTVLEWLQEGAEGDRADFADEVIEYADQGRQALDARQLFEAQLAPDGRFTLTDGRQLYLLEAQGKRWKPTLRT